MGLSDVLYAAYARRLTKAARRVLGAAPRRGHARRQPPLGPRPGRRRERGPPGRRRQHRQPPVVVRRGGRRGRHPLAALDRQPQPSRGRAAPAARHHREGRRRARRDPPLADPPRRRPRPAARRRRPAGSRPPRTAPATSTGCSSTSPSGYGGRREIADAVRSLLQEHASRGTSIEELAEVIDVEHIAEHLYTKGQPDPDLVIRTSGEQRLGGFLLWQSAHSEFYFCEAYWPDFRKVDFLRALRAFGERHRRFGVLTRRHGIRALRMPRRSPIRTTRHTSPSRIRTRPKIGPTRGARPARQRFRGVVASRPPKSSPQERPWPRARDPQRSHVLGRSRAAPTCSTPRSSSPIPRAITRFKEHEVVLPGRRRHRARGQAPPPGARLLRPHRPADARRPADLGRPARRPRADRRRRRHAAGRAQPHRPHVAARRASASATTTPGSSPSRATSPTRVASSRSSARTCRCGSRRRPAGSRPRSTAPSSPSSRAGPAWPSSTSPSRRWTTSTSTAASRASRPPSCPATPA